MSRTVRRIKNVNPNYGDSYTHDFIGQDNWCWGTLKKVPLPKPLFDKGWWRFHRDHHQNWWKHSKLHRSAWGDVRTKNRNNLVSHLRNPEVECFFWEDVNTRDWD